MWLDQFFISEDLAKSISRFFCWSYNSRVLDHTPIVLQLDMDKRKQFFPFNFNHVWLEEKGFIKFVEDSWGSSQKNLDASPMYKLVKNLNSLCRAVFDWEKKKKLSLREDIMQI